MAVKTRTMVVKIRTRAVQLTTPISNAVVQFLEKHIDRNLYGDWFSWKANKDGSVTLRSVSEHWCDVTARPSDWFVVEGRGEGRSLYVLTDGAYKGKRTC